MSDSHEEEFGFSSKTAKDVLEKTLRDCIDIVNKVSDSSVPPGTKLVAATSLVPILFELTITEALDDKDDEK